MALLNFVLPRAPRSLSSFSYHFSHCSKKVNHFVAGELRVYSFTTSTLRNYKDTSIRSEAVVAPSINGAGVIPTSTIVPDYFPYLKRSDFPSDFKFGTSTSAFQTEGPASIGGRGPSTWDYMITQGQEFPGIPAADNVATLSYTKYREDVQLLKAMGVDVYRFSISWSRILPDGNGVINQKGIDFYNNLINELIANGIEPFVTLFHFDLPVALQNEYHGFLDSKIVENFKNYSDICFKSFGDRVKRWVTINEPDIFAQHGYKMGLPQPDDPTKNPYTAAHNILLAHAAATTHYKQYYQATQGGEIGISMSVLWFKPLSDFIADKDAADRAFSFMVGWFMEPLVYGDYPFIMRAIVGDRLPSFTDEEKKMVQGSYDFIGVNYYTARYAKGVPISSNEVPVGYSQDEHVIKSTHKDGEPIGNPVDGNPHIFFYPEGLQDALISIKHNYQNPKIYITENGVSEPRNDDLPLEKALDDEHRILFILRHLNAIQEAMREGVNVKGYFVWALLDCMEIGAGDTYTTRFGLNFTDYTNELKRYPKKSALWLSSFLKGQRD